MPKKALIISICIALVVVGVDVAAIRYLRLRTLDVQTLSDISQIRSALESYRVTNNMYPRIPEPTPLADAYLGTQKLCSDGFRRFTDSCDRVLLERVPSSGYLYRSLFDGGDYQMQFKLLTSLRRYGFVRGYACATSAGITNQPCF